MDWGRVGRVVALATLLGAVTTGTAAAAEAPLGNAAFVSAGVQVYPLGAVGFRCRGLGLCDGVPAELAASATPRYLSTRAGEAVAVECESAGVAKVVGFFARGQDVVAGWADAGKLRLRTAEPVPACGVLRLTGTVLAGP